MSGNEIENVAAIACRTIRPQTRLLAVQHHLEAVARAAEDVANQKLAPTLLSRREHRGENRFQACDQFGANLVPLAVVDVAPARFSRW